jgi:hypothetical protein
LDMVGERISMSFGPIATHSHMYYAPTLIRVSSTIHSVIFLLL